ncbi:MAG: triose-phosphate isomerase, partial [Bacteroidota bacterium]
MRKQIAAGNWKMNTDLGEGKKLINELLDELEKRPLGQKGSASEVVLGVPFITLHEASSLVKGQGMIQVAAQNCHSKSSGAYTGEISVDMIRSTGATYVIIGHSERREYFDEDYQFLKDKVDITLEKELTPIFCCGEQLDIREEEKHFNLVKEQVESSLFHLDHDQIRKVVIAYEPVWAIGTGKTATPEQAQEMHAFIRDLLTQKYGKEVAGAISILYGGSVKADNAEE